MKHLLRKLALFITILFALIVQAQPAPPYTVTVSGTVVGCTPNSFVNIVAVQGTQPSFDIDVPVNPADCSFGIDLDMVSFQGWFQVSTQCSGVNQSQTVNYTVNALDPDSTLVTVIFNCGNAIDCMGVPGGGALPGTSCTTFLGLQGTWSANCACIPNGTPVNDECNAPTMLLMHSECVPVSGNLSGATESFSPVNCNGFVSGTANDVWYSFIATGTSATIQATGDGNTTDGLDLVLEVFEESCTFASIACSDAVIGGGQEEVVITTIPGMMYYYRLYPFTPQGPTTFTYTTCVFGDPTIVDCEGVVGGPALPGTPCTILGGGMVFTGTWSSNCVCDTIGTGAVDCLGIPNGPNVPGSPCTDPATGVGGFWAADCSCTPGTNPDCEAGFWVLQAYENGDTTGAGVPIPNTLWVWNLTSGGTGFYQFVWDFGDGSTSTEAFPTHIYADSGPYVLCLTITDSDGCTDMYCDSVSVDEDGLYTGLIGDSGNRSALTLNVVNPLSTGVAEDDLLTTVTLWPNPARDVLNIALDSRNAGAAQIEVLDLNGRLVMQEQVGLNTGNNRIGLDTGALPAGLYALRISHHDQVTTQRFVRD